MPSEQAIGWIAALIAGTACVLLHREARLRWTARAKRRLAITFAVLSIATYFHFGALPAGFLHRWEMFHYVMGAKYARELGYERLYVCTAIADAETGNRVAVQRRRMRDLRNDAVISSAAVLANTGECTSHFTAARWQDFRRDVAWFRRSAGAGRWWDAMQLDHGYNPSPVWSFAGHAFTSNAPVSDAGLLTLALIDPVLMALAIVALGWGFGGRAALLGVVFWGTQAASPFFWTGGAFLRQDWLLAAVLAMVCLRRRWFFWAGVALGYAALVRVFPLLLWAGPLVLVAREVVRERELSRRWRRFFAGGALTAALMLPLGGYVAGPHAYIDFQHHLRMHASTPIANHMSLRTLFSFEPAARIEGTFDASALDPVARWSEARRARLERLSVPYWLTAAAFVLAFALVCWRVRTPWIALGVSLLLVVCLTDPSCYYYSLWLLAVPLTRARRSLEVAVVGLAAVGQLLVRQLPYSDDQYVALAALYVGFTLIMLCAFSHAPRMERALHKAPS